MITLLFFTLFIVLMIAGVPVAFALGIPALLFIYFVYDLPWSILVERQMSSVDQFTYIAIPLFILAGNLMTEGGLTRHLADLITAILGRIRGGLSHATVGTCMVVAGMTGSDLADAAAVGSVMIPAMKRAGYPKAYGAAVVSAAAACGPLIPPSIILIIYGMLTNTSVGVLFLGGAIPGILLGLYVMGAGYIIATLRGFPIEQVSWKQAKSSFLYSLPALALPIIVVGGILLGIFTPTEASTAAVIWAALMGILVFRSLGPAKLASVLLDSTKTSASLLIIVAMAGLFSWVVTLQQVGPLLAHYLTATTSSPTMFLLLVNIAFLLLGCVMESIPILLIFVPILFPSVLAYGIDPSHFGVMVVLNLMIGLSTPPFGLSMFLVCRLAGITPLEFVKEYWPFFLAQVGCLMTVMLFPSIVLFLPHLVFGGPR
jgi:C4-dicarboxylate transporter, DctM subunit